MSRMSRLSSVALAIFAASQAQADQLALPPVDATALYAAKFSADARCRKTQRADDIVVCGRREADKYRVPLIIYVAGDPRAEGFWGEKERLQRKTTPCQQRGPFLIGCGAVGVTAGFKAGKKGVEWRPLAK